MQSSCGKISQRVFDFVNTSEEAEITAKWVAGWFHSKRLCAFSKRYSRENFYSFEVE